ncbi:NTP/NDP exchange transporter [Pseudoxanthomonas wuyuanensis]|uniref:ATP:ADP antiporter, AAA family n=1 Tax=Pseudoxanthomonas wuyuanensis TaxID=1073196 RepID=A0A286CZ03_9GAMM|nr:MFS transporter [Pseudoxanthomonas wuyuanensis]KAF1717181.1 MFS transporter [Pseudoxanthomonas wuyuanensis]SOD51599.1 ATP:ADP antiporter, AAA family [Pseudoxanthomonas wuyuanensis]
MSRTAIPAPRRPRLLQALFNLRREEIVPVLIAALFFFCVLTALMLLRPARDALGMERGIESIRWLFIGTAVVTLAVNPLFGWLVSRLRRLQFIGATYGFFVLSLVGFWALLMFAPDAVGQRSGQVFFVWFSVFNLFVTMVFWALLADRFTSDQGKRFFALISVGGTLGAIFGPWLTSQLAQPLGTPSLLLVAGGFLLLALAMAWLLVHVAPDRVGTGAPAATTATAGFASEAERIGGSAWAGLRAVFRSRYLTGIAGYILLMTVVATLVYFTRLQMVAAVADDTDARAAIFGNIDMWTQVAVLVLQLTLTGKIIKRFGLGVALAILPVATALGFIGLAVYGSFVVLILLEAVNRAVQRGITRPAREALFTVVSREEKYKAKAFVDTFMYRTGDVIGAQTEGALGRLGLAMGGLVSMVVPLALVWAALGIWLGRAQARRVVLPPAPTIATPEISDGAHDSPGPSAASVAAFPARPTRPGPPELQK